MSKQKLYIDNEVVELTEESSVAINYSINDISEPDKVKGDFSKKITLPGSKAVNKAFANIFEINIDLTGASFNPNIKATALYTVGDIDILDGFVQLKKINWSNGVCHSYEINIFGRNANLFNDIGEAKLEDVDLSSYDHDWTLANQVTSWTATTGEGYVYPLIDYGFDNDETATDVTHLFPAVYAKEYVDQIFSDAGYSYNSSFFDSAYFKSLIIPFNGTDLRLTETQIDDRTVIVQDVTGATTAASITPATKVVTFDTEVQDNDGQIVVPSTTITVGETGYYNLVAEGNYNAVFTPTTPAVNVTSMVGVKVITRIKVDSGGGAVPVGQKNLWMLPDGNFLTSYTTSTVDSPPSDEYWGDVDGFGNLLTNNLYDPANISFATRNNILLTAGDTVTMDYIVSLFYQAPYAGTLGFTVGTDLFEIVASPGTYDTGTVSLNLNAADFRMIPVVTSLVEGNGIEMNSAIPRDIKQVDFLKGIINMHNLYVQPQRNNPNVLDIEPRDDFYTSDVVDWSSKLDLSNDVCIEPLGALKNRIFNFKYKEDGDYYNKEYQDRYLETYGRREIIIDNEFLKTTKEMSVIFSPSPLVGDESHDRVTPEIFDTDSVGNKVQFQSNIRILQYGGLKSTNTGWTHTSSLVADVVNTTYPYSGHLDDPYNPTIDINWGLPREIFYDGTWQAVSGTNNNLTNAYYYNYINEISNVNSKLVTAYFNLTALDIHNLSFKKEYFFNNSYFRLQKIVDYNPINCELTKCVFIKLADITDFTASTFVINGGTGTVTGGVSDEELPMNTKAAQNGNVVGKRRDVRVTGNDNYIDPSATNVNLLGNDNSVQGDVNNVTIFGDGYTVNQSDVFIVDGAFINVDNTGLTVQNKTNSFSLNNIVSAYTVDTTSKDVTITKPVSSIRIGRPWIIKKKVQKNKIILRFTTSLVDGEQEIEIKNENTSIFLWYDGSTFWIA